MTIQTGNCTANRKLTPRTDQTSLRLFFQLLHKAREMNNKAERKNITIRRAILRGILWTYHMNHEDFCIADQMRDYWKHQNSGERK